MTYVVLVALGWFFFVRPLGRRVSDQQVALYLEEHEPSLQEMLLSAVDVGSPDRPIERTGESAELLRQLVKSAVERCQASDLGRGLERQSLRTSLAALGGHHGASPRSSSVSARRTCARARLPCSCRSRAPKPPARTAST